MHCISNPASESATVTYEIYSEGLVEIKVYNLFGQPVLDLQQGAKELTLPENILLVKLKVLSLRQK